ncbi:MAG: (Fe-S)-binding protein [Desulfobacteraceae bacterium]|nr:MAG: (Fe-S)-binding protein [Desulfobacteraceae bacterium]
MKTTDENGSKSVSAEIDNCAKCGSCRSVCPVFAEYGLEKKAARGKIALCQAASEGALPLSEGLDEALEDCLLCLACTENCSRGVQTHKIVKAARAQLFRKLAKKEKYGAPFPAALPEAVPERSGLRYFLHGGENIPPIRCPSFRKTHAESFQAAEPGDTVLFFTGCFIDHVFPAVGEAVLKVFTALQCRVVATDSQGCCGASAVASGDMETARSLAVENIEAFDGNHPVIVACASGGRMLKFEYPEIFGEGDPRRKKAESLAARTFDISEYLAERIGMQVISSRIKDRCRQPLTYHDPCQLSRGQKIRNAPRTLLEAACGENLIETRLSNLCCGSGMVYGVSCPETSKKILSKKIEDLIRSGAKTVATGCPVCMRQLSKGCRDRGANIEIRHTIEILAESMGL